MTTDTQAAAAILREAADIMIAGGYVAGERAHYGAHCALGAIDKVSYGRRRGRTYKQYELAQNALAKIVKDKIPPETVDHYNSSMPYGERLKTLEVPYRVGTTIATWSNMIACSAEKVAGCMRATAEILELEETEEKSHG